MALTDYAIIPFVANPSLYDYSEWLRIGYNSIGRDGWLCSRINTFIKCAYVKRNDYIVVAGAMEQVYGNYDTYVSGSYDHRSWGVSTHNYSLLPEMFCDDVSYTQSVEAMINSEIPIYQTREEAYAAFNDGIWTPQPTTFPITYRLTNCTAPDAPSEASIGSIVTVPFVFPDGYGIVNNENVYVTNNGVIVPSTYSDGVLTFEMPNPG